MFRRLIRDESGIAMGLAVMMIVLVGVLGAGLLVFVRNDLEAVVEVNQGQRAMNLTDAGVQAAKRQLRSDADPNHYDSNTTENVAWAYIRPSGVPMKTLALGEGSVKVTIQYLLPSMTTLDLQDQNHAPELVPTGQTDYPGDKRYFRVISEGTAGQARRKVEAIFYTSKLDVPTAYYTPTNITIQGNIDISGVSFFAKGNINKVGSSITINRTAPALYGDWDTTKFNPPSNLNTRPRTNALGQPVQGAGLAAEGTVADFGGGTRGVYDYDSNTATRFVRKANPNSPNAPGTISYPFNPDAEFDLDFFMEEAKRQGNYRSSAVDISNSNYPATSNDQTVFFVDANGSTSFLQYRVSQNLTAGSGGVARGTIIVRNGNLTINNSSNGFNGVIIITGDGTNTGKYDSGGSDVVQGFVIASGDMAIRGSTAPFVVTEGFTTRPGFYAVRQWSWRECYNTTCS
jgi:hypothetical protein